MAKEEKKKKGCFSRILRFLITAVMIVVGFVFVSEFLFGDEEGSEDGFGDNYDGVELISQQEIDSGNEDISFSDLMDMFFGYYGYYPDEDDSNEYGYSHGGYYNDDDYESYDFAYDPQAYDDYYSNFDNSHSSNYYDDYYKDYYTSDGDSKTSQNNSSQSSGNYQSTPEETKTSSGSTATSVASSQVSNFVECAKRYLGTPYVWGGTSKSGIDCSGLVYLAAQDAGLGKLPRTAKTLQQMATRISDSDRKAGDLVFFSSGNSISHVAIYLDKNQIIHAVSDGSKTGVIISSLSENYWKQHYYSSGRIISDSVVRKRAVQRARVVARSRARARARSAGTDSGTDSAN